MIRPKSLRTRGLALLLALAAAVPAGAPLAQVRLPSLGDEAGEEFSVATERMVGEQIMREIRRDPDYLDDPVLLEYLQGVWQPLVRAAKQRGDIQADSATQLAWEVFLVRDRTVNAFALPGGYVGVNLGLIAMTASTDELASVLAHEMSHVSQRHIARGIANTQRVSMLSLAGLVLGMLAASRAGSPDAMQAVVAGSQAAAAQGQLNYSRDMEREADRIGFGVLTDAGYAPAGMSAMFEKLENANRLNDTGAFPYLRTHPLTVDRISEARARALQSGPGQLHDATLHGVMAARARVLMDSAPPSLRRLADRLDGDAALAALPPAERLATLYAGGLAALQLREPAAAEAAAGRALATLRVAPPASPGVTRAFVLLQADARLQRGDGAGALALLDGAAMPGDSRAVMLARSQAALALAGAGSPDAARDLQRSAEALQTWLSLRRHDALGWQTLAQVEAARGQKLRSMRAEAESRAAIGDLTGAIDRLRAAQSLVRGGSANDEIEASVIDSRLRQLTNERRLLAQQMRGGRGPQPE